MTIHLDDGGMVLATNARAGRTDQGGTELRL